MSVTKKQELLKRRKMLERQRTPTNAASIDLQIQKVDQQLQMLENGRQADRLQSIMQKH